MRIVPPKRGRGESHRASCTDEILPESSHSMHQDPVNTSVPLMYPVRSQDANGTLPSNPPYWQAVNFENPRFEPDATPQGGFECTDGASYARSLAQTLEAVPLPSFDQFPPYELSHVDVGSIGIPQIAASTSPAGRQDNVKALSRQWFICSRCQNASVATVEELDQQDTIHEQEPSIGAASTESGDAGLRGSPEQQLHRVKCLEKPNARGGYIRPANASARGLFTCTSGCGVNFARKKDWRRHEDNNYPRHNYLCTICSQRFARRDRLTSHMKKVHKERDFTALEASIQPLPDNYNRRCPVCESSFPKLADFYDHVVEMEHFKRRAIHTSPAAQVQGPHLARNELLIDDVPDVKSVGFDFSDSINSVVLPPYHPGFEQFSPCRDKDMSFPIHQS